MTKRLPERINIAEERMVVLKKDVFAEYSRMPIVNLMYQRMQFLSNEQVLVYKFKTLKTANSVAHSLKRMIKRNNIIGMKVIAGKAMVSVYRDETKGNSL